VSEIRFTLTGRSPLLQHNPRLSDPDDPIVKEIKAITSKRTKTEDDRRAIEKLEWFGGLYTDPSLAGPVVPSSHIRKCLINAATATRNGKDIERSISFFQPNFPLSYDGPRDLDQLWGLEAHRYRLPVVVQRARTWRMRPGFPSWVVIADAFLMDDLLDFETLQRIVERAGLAEGLSDGRKIGYGRFTGEVVRR
jgi:hypothetical protein